MHDIDLLFDKPGLKYERITVLGKESGVPG